MKTYFACDLKSFYASVECRERGLDPLTARLVVADASRTSKTICLAVTPALKAYGLSGRSRLFEVEQKAKQVKRETGKTLDYIVAVPRMALYMEYSARIYSIYLKYFAPEDIHVYSIDEVFVDMTSYLPFYKVTAHQLAMKVIQNILKETGITATAGIAPNLYLCKIAMDIVAKHIPADKDGVRIAELDEHSYREQLWDHTPITDFWRIGNGIAARLARNCMFTMGDIARRSLTNEDSLYKLFGIDAEILIDHAWGYEPCTLREIKAYKSEKNSLSTGQVLHQPYSYEMTRVVIKEMAEQLALDLFRKGLVTSSISLYIGYDASGMGENFYGDQVMDFYGRLMPKPVHGSCAVQEESCSSSQIVEAAEKIFCYIADPELNVRRINITANDTKPKNAVQPSLFAQFKDPEEEKEDRLQQARLDIMSKYGKNAILRGMDLEECATTRDRNAQIGGHKA